MNSIDASLLIWLNGLSGSVKIFDDLMRVIASDYLMPLVLSLSMFGLWFSGKTPFPVFVALEIVARKVRFLRQVS